MKHSNKTSLLLRFFILVFSAFFLFSCQHIHKKSSCGLKKAGLKQGDCRKACSKAGKKACSKACKKACKAKGKKACKKDSCQYDSVVGVAVIKDLSGNKIKGLVSFEKSKDGQVKVQAEVQGLQANKKFGFHVHEFGTCENKALMAGGHLNPWKSRHGGSKDQDRHLGDLGNLESNNKGEAKYSENITGRLKMLMGRSVIIHAKADDLKSQPTGNAGERIACGIITAGLSPFTKTPEETKTPDIKTKEPKMQKPPKKPTQKTETKKSKETKQPETQEPTAQKPPKKAQKEAVKAQKAQEEPSNQKAQEAPSKAEPQKQN